MNNNLYKFTNKYGTHYTTLSIAFWVAVDEMLLFSRHSDNLLRTSKLYDIIARDDINISDVEYALDLSFEIQEAYHKHNNRVNNSHKSRIYNIVDNSQVKYNPPHYPARDAERLNHIRFGAFA